MHTARPVFLVVLAAGCHAEPSSTPPVASSVASPAALGSAEARRTAGQRTCEPAAHCGVWAECQSFERIDQGTPERWRAETGPSKGAIFTRRHHCFPEDAGTSGCQVYCTGAGAASSCVDALVAEDEECTAHAAPRPAPFSCEVRGAACVRVGGLQAPAGASTKP
ncbi:hypothetical protein [Polyangium sp. 6x1]|uniref:hypothetical protein n=1 Tax=Polyangium sp. 6x1 TaxID=3042689 RepID=UPI0024830FD4|nr:hypothetical protein [Polyangium sp. 6x1]MDI1442562.1 hypothetical protein [Polyangium sp. 6x1]